MKHLLFISFISIALIGCEVEAQPLLEIEPSYIPDGNGFSRALSDAEIQDSIFWKIYGTCETTLAIIENMDREILPGYENCKWESEGLKTIGQIVRDLVEVAHSDWDTLLTIATGNQKTIMEWRDPYVQQAFIQVDEYAKRWIMFADQTTCGSPLDRRFFGAIRFMYRMEYLVDDMLEPTARIFQRF